MQTRVLFDRSIVIQGNARRRRCLWIQLEFTEYANNDPGLAITCTGFARVGTQVTIPSIQISCLNVSCYVLPFSHGVTGVIPSVAEQ